MSDLRYTEEARRGLATQSLMARAYIAIMGLGFGFGLYMAKTHSLQDNLIDLFAEVLVIVLISKLETSEIVIENGVNYDRAMTISFTGEFSL